MITVNLTQAEFDDLVAKAENWDTLGDEIDANFQEFKEFDMVVIGHMAAAAFGFIE